MASGIPESNAVMLARLKALADPTRLAIIELLKQGTQCNCEIAPALDLSLSLVSHHMRILREAGLVSAEKDPDDARWVYYTLAPEALSELRASLDQVLDPTHIQTRERCCGKDACRRP
ncbi:MAG: metalloregulator ArsR/SmtB family transcription factor [Chloroflexi bacterium]|nr:metalloregulator ArsR/SmtB family transcription factor [Chloroflexota bacterium]